MPLHYKSMLAARELMDIFSKIGWSRHGLISWGEETENTVALQYKSEAMGETRIVSADPLRLMAWLRDAAMRPGSYAAFLRILDRKPERAARTAAQPVLFRAEELAQPVRRSMAPNEQH